MRAARSCSYAFTPGSASAASTAPSLSPSSDAVGDGDRDRTTTSSAPGVHPRATPPDDSGSRMCRFAGDPAWSEAISFVATGAAPSAPTASSSSMGSSSSIGSTPLRSLAAPSLRTETPKKDLSVDCFIAREDTPKRFSGLSSVGQTAGCHRLARELSSPQQISVGFAKRSSKTRRAGRGARPRGATRSKGCSFVSVGRGNSERKEPRWSSPSRGAASRCRPRR